MRTFAKAIVNAGGHIIARGVARGLTLTGVARGRLTMTEQRHGESPAARAARSRTTSPPGVLVVIDGSRERGPGDVSAVSRGHDAD